MPDADLNSEQKDFIRKHAKLLTVRQIAKRLAINRAGIEAFLAECFSEKQDSAGPVLTKTTTLRWGLTLFAGALLVRLVYVFCLAGTPFWEPLSLQAGNKLDDGIYVTMARQMITEGNWLGIFPLGAYRIPLYAYFLAGCFRLFGNSLLPVHCLQALIGSLTVWLIYLTTGLIFKNRRVAQIAGILAAFYIPSIFFEHLMVGETLSVFFNCLAIFLICSVFVAPDQKSTARFFLSGLMMGLSCLLRPNTLLPVLAVGAFTIYHFAFRLKNIRRALALALTLWFSVSIPLAASTVRNWATYEDFLPVSAIGGINFYMGNGPGADGKFRLIEGMGTSLDQIIDNSEKMARKESARTLKPSEISSFWFHKTLEYMATQPAVTAGLLMKKIALFFNRYEFPDILDIGFAAQWIPFLGVGRFFFGFMELAAVLGIAFLWRKKNPALEAIGAFFLSYSLSIVLFIITARYRLPAAICLIPISAYGIDRLVIAWENKNPASLWPKALLGLLSAFIIFWPVRTSDFAVSYNSLGIAMKYRQDPKQAEKYYRQAIQISPAYPSPYLNLSILLASQGKTDEATSLRRQYEALKAKI